MIGNADKILGWSDRLRDYLNGGPVVPVTLEVQPSGKCNQKCKYCDGHNMNGHTMSRCDISRIVDESIGVGVGGIVWSGGGEPLLNNDFTSFPIRGIKSGLITNGSVAMPCDFWRQFSWVRFSVDSMQADEYHSVRGVEMPSCLKDNITAAGNVTYTGIQAVATRGIPIGPLVEAAKNMGVGYIQIRPDERSEHPYWPEMELASCQGDCGIDVIVRNDKRAKRSWPCVAGNFMMTIASDMTCHICSCAGSPATRFGDLRDSSLSDIVYSQQRAEAIDMAGGRSCPIMCKGANINRAFAGDVKHARFL